MPDAERYLLRLSELRGEGTSEASIAPLWMVIGLTTKLSDDVRVSLMERLATENIPDFVLATDRVDYCDIKRRFRSRHQ